MNQWAAMNKSSLNESWITQENAWKMEDWNITFPCHKNLNGILQTDVYVPQRCNVAWIDLAMESYD